MIFEDASRLRWKAVRVVTAGVALLAILVLADMAASFFTRPLLPRLPGMVRAKVTAFNESLSTPRGVPSTLAPEPRRMLPGEGFVRTAFVVQDDAAGLTDLRRHLDDLDVVFPDVFTCGTADGQLHEQLNPAFADTCRGSHVHVMPRLCDTNEKGEWAGRAFGTLMRDANTRGTLERALVARLAALGAAGVNVDVEALSAGDREPLTDFLTEFATLLHRSKLQLTVDVPMNDDAFDDDAIGRIADAVVLMAYDQHYEGGPPGPVAGTDWVAAGIEETLTHVPAKKLIVALGAYGFDWTVGSKNPAESLGFMDAMKLAGRVGADIEIKPGSVNSHFAYRDHTGLHRVWFLDAVSAYNQFTLMRRAHAGGVSFWRMGFEEPACWGFFGRGSDGFDPRTLQTLKPLDAVRYEGAGELLRVRSLPADGKRSLSIAKGLVERGAYDRLPETFSVENFGHVAGKVVAFTFDDGPDPTWTPAILNVLDREQVRATFFVIGDQAQRYPDLLGREFSGGHVLGNHTFLHPNIGTISETRLRAELNSTQRVIESVTGRQTLLFRAPYDTDSAPRSPAQLTPLYVAGQLGYTTVAADVDSEDFLRLGSSRIAQTVESRLKATGGNVVVMHDAGGDRSQTVRALADLIPSLRAQGYRFVTVNELLGVPPDAVMPRAPASERVVAFGGGTMTWLRTWGWGFIKILFMVTTAISALRILVLGTFVFRSQRSAGLVVDDFTPAVLVVVPAYNEEKVITRTLGTLGTSDYPHFRVLVVDDGSTDATAKLVRDFAQRDRRVSLLTQPNGGKFTALNRAFRQSPFAYVVTIDADTLVLPGTLRALMAPFADARVDAVCGNVQVGNVRNLLTAFQEVEYVTSQNYDRRAFDAVNCISVVPGATGAWKRDAVLRAGGYSGQTLTEDADLTLSLLTAGGKIVYAPAARSITEAPEGVRALFKQRFRWSYGTFQCLWKHRRQLGRGRLGWIALPNMLLFQIAFPVLSPVGDLVLVLALLRGDAGAVAAGYVIFLMMDLAGSMIAFLLDHKPLRHLWVVLVQRFFYRQFMYAVTFRALVEALRGRRHGWNKLERTAAVGAGRADASLEEETANATVKSAGDVER